MLGINVCKYMVFVLGKIRDHHWRKHTTMQITEIVKSHDKAIDRNIRGIRLQESQFLLKANKANKGHAQTESSRRCTYTAAKKGTKRYVMSMPCCENIDKQSFKTHSTWRWRDALQLRMLAPLSVPST